MGQTQAEEWDSTFKESFCRVYRVKPEHYENAVFWRCVYRHALPFVAMLFRRNPGYFHEDFYLIREVGNIRRPELFTQELNYFHGRNRRDKSFLRSTFALRVSAKRLIKLKNKVLRAIQRQA